MGRTGVKLLWGPANLFSNPRYAHGAATSPNADVFAFAYSQNAPLDQIADSPTLGRGVELLREQGYTCERGEIFYAETRQRVVVEPVPELVAQTMEIVEQA